MCFLGTHVHICPRMSDGGFPVYISQLKMPVIVVWAERPPGSILKSLCLFYIGSAPTSYRINFPLNYSQVHTAAPDIFHFGISSRDVFMRGCAYSTVSW